MMVACDPAENRDVLSGAITASDLKISATPVLVNGKKSNNIELNSDGNGCLSSWNYGNGTTVSTKTTVQLVLKGANDIVYTGLNHDGTTITKTLTVQIDTLINVPPEWGILCGTGTKSWVWDDTQADAVWGNGGYLGNTSPGWWKVPLADMNAQAAGEGAGAEMIFSVHGSSLTKKKTNSTTAVGSFAFDMTAKTILGDGTVWAKGKLTTKNVTVLAGFVINENTNCYSYDILTLDNSKMALACPRPGAGSWGEATFWMFRAK
jgi:hypothetical protein